MQRAHLELLHQYIFKGAKIQKLETNPLSSSDAMHGQPTLWTMILNEIADEQDRLMNQSLQESFI